MNATILENAPAEGDFNGDEFSNNLFSDLAPLLTLFGEQVTRQFLSMSLCWADNFLLAMGPLGIITIMTSAVRVGGVKKLKALVGRAREGRATAEQELLSSTSDDVCEVWSGEEIVRLLGNPAGMKNLLITSEGEVHDLKSAVRCEVLSSPIQHRNDEASEDPLTQIFQAREDSLEQIIVDSLNNAPPNLALNITNATASADELWRWAVLGILLQLVGLIIPGLTTYYWHWTKAGTPVQSYGYPCFLIGSVFVILGVLGCGHVIEGKTVEHEFDKGEKALQYRIIRLQGACTVSDQHFPSFAILNAVGDTTLRTSRLMDGNTGLEQRFSKLAAISTFVTLAGFIVQFVGLRALHWSATILLLGITLIMTGIRSWVRRGLAVAPDTEPLLDGHEIAWLALHRLSLFGWKAGGSERVADNDNGGSGTLVHTDNEAQLRLELDGFQDAWNREVQRLKHLPSHSSIHNQTDFTWLVRKIFGGRREELFWELFTGRNAIFQLMFELLQRVYHPIDDRFRGPMIQLYRHLGPSNCQIRPKVTLDIYIQDGNHPQIPVFGADELKCYQQIRQLVPSLTRSSGIPQQARVTISAIEGAINYLWDINTIDWKNVNRNSTHMSEDPDDEFTELYVRPSRESPLLRHCCQELFSLFMLAVASRIREVGGITERKSHAATPSGSSTGAARGLENSVFRTLAADLVSSGLADDMTDAYRLIIPAFAKYNLLPKEDHREKTFPRSGEQREETITDSSARQQDD
ncbi:hypothetical protein DL763_005923 [Monosporascus cannonballus]|nr:hypothetical protein DL763_005923 [Monosporascus cannonballus]